MTDDNTSVEVDGEPTTQEQLIARIKAGARIESVTLSRTETRQRAQYTPNAYFLSMQLRYSELWDLVEIEDDPAMKNDMSQIIRTQIHDDIMRHENYISGVLLHMQMKDDVPTFPRRPDNPALTAANLREAIETISGQA